MGSRYYVLGFSNFGGVERNGIRDKFRRCILMVEIEEDKAPSYYFGTFKPETAAYQLEKFRVISAKFEDTNEDASEVPIRLNPFRERIYRPGCEVNLVKRKTVVIGFLREDVCKSYQVKRIENGVLRKWYDNGCLQRTTEFVNGKRTGETRAYNIFEQLTCVENYRNGRLDGECIYYDIFQEPYQIKWYRAGFPHGPEKTYSKGRLVFLGEYCNGKPHGYFKSYDGYGMITKQLYYNRGVQQIQL